MKADDRDYQDFLRDILNSIDKIGYFIEEFDFNDFPSFASGARSPFRFAQEDLSSGKFYKSINILVVADK
jgi:hypothetical protein